MGKGKIVFEDDYESPETQEIPPDSIWESIFKVVCDKK